MKSFCSLQSLEYLSPQSLEVKVWFWSIFLGKPSEDIVDILLPLWITLKNPVGFIFKTILSTQKKKGYLVRMPYLQRVATSWEEKAAVIYNPLNFIFLWKGHQSRREANDIRSHFKTYLRFRFDGQIFKSPKTWTFSNRTDRTDF